MQFQSQQENKRYFYDDLIASDTGGVEPQLLWSKYMNTFKEKSSLQIISIKKCIYFWLSESNKKNPNQPNKQKSNPQLKV